MPICLDDESGRCLGCPLHYGPPHRERGRRDRLAGRDGFIGPVQGRASNHWATTPLMSAAGALPWHDVATV